MIEKQQDQSGGTGVNPPQAAQFVHIPSIADAKEMPEGGRPMRLDPRVLSRIQNAVSTLEQDYGDVLVDQVSNIQQLADGIAAGSAGDLQALYELAHDIRGVAKTFSRPLAGAIADSLCSYVDMLPDQAAPDTDIIREHVNALSQMARLTPEPNGSMADTILARVAVSRSKGSKRSDLITTTAPL